MYSQTTVRPIKIRPHDAFTDLDEGKKMIEKKALTEGGIKYCEQTSLHGWQYIPTEDWYIRKIYWWIVCLGTVFVYFCAIPICGHQLSIRQLIPTNWKLILCLL